MCSGLVQAGKSTFQNAFVAMFIIETKTQKLYEINPAKPHGENYMTCPVCSETRKKKREKCFVWNADKQIGHCCHCNATFSAHMSLKCFGQR